MVRCPKCAIEIDADEEELEEGEILNCEECKAELEVVQTHPVRINVITDEDDDEDEDALKEDKAGEEEDEEEEELE